MWDFTLSVGRVHRKGRQRTQTRSDSCLCTFTVAGEGRVSIQSRTGYANTLPNIYRFQESSEGLDQLNRNKLQF